jgi:hypothetical protein
MARAHAHASTRILRRLLGSKPSPRRPVSPRPRPVSRRPFLCNLDLCSEPHSNSNAARDPLLYMRARASPSSIHHRYLTTSPITFDLDLLLLLHGSSAPSTIGTSTVQASSSLQISVFLLYDHLLLSRRSSSCSCFPMLLTWLRRSARALGFPWSSDAVVKPPR